MKTIKTQIENSQLEAAMILGISDFHKGVNSVPCLSKACMSLVEVNQHIKGATIAIMNAWTKGWHSANLSNAIDN